MSKRLLDILGASIGLMIFSPIFLIIAFLIKRDSPGPAIFTQTRYTRHKTPFTMYKFRTMTDKHKSPEDTLTKANDQRVTKIGQVLRKYKLDELPQLLNVLLGDMSIVGPRPVVVPEVELQEYGQSADSIIFQVKSGLTDYASICFYSEFEYLNKGSDSSRYYAEVILPFKLKLKAMYVEELKRQGIWVDLKLIALTIFRLFGYKLEIKTLRNKLKAL